jgi:hypothetical protein
MKAQEWWERGQEQEDPFYALGDSWKAFNNLFSSGRKGDERTRIKSYLNDELDDAQAQSVLEKHDKEID